MNNKKGDTLVFGLALFAMFFGAGNLIFPPYLGLISGESWVSSVIGFFITGIGMPLLGVIAAAKVGGSIDDVCSRVHPVFSKILGTVIILAIGPLLAIPRTGATTYEIGAAPMIEGISPVIVAIVYFGITLILVINESGVVDKIGKVLTPCLLFILAIIIIKGIISPSGEAITTDISQPFTRGFTEGYQTMDAIAAILLGGMIVSNVYEKGYRNKKDQVSITTKAALIAASGLILVYGGLTYLGSRASGNYPGDIPRTTLIMNIVQNILGNGGKIALGLAVSLACLTTSVGLVSIVGDYFSTITKGRLKYKPLVVITCVFSAVISCSGVDSIVLFSGPLLTLVYPMTIVLILLTLFGNFIKNDNVFRGAVLFAFLVSLIEVIGSYGILTSLSDIVAKIPLASIGFAWLIPAVIGMIIGALIPSKKR